MSAPVSTPPAHSRRSLATPAASSITSWALRVLVAACLVVDAVVHLQLASGYGQATAPGHLSEGLLFRVEAFTAIAVALLVLIAGNRAAFALAFAVAASAFVVVVAYRYLNIPALGPIPAMYEPLWFTKKTATAIAEGTGALAAAIGYTHARPRSHSRGQEHHSTGRLDDLPTSTHQIPRSSHG